MVRPRSDAGFVERLVLFLGASGLAGVLAAGLFLPAAGGLGVLARNTTESFQDLPSELQAPPLPQQSRILAADGSVLATFYFENRISVPLDQIAPVMRNAIIAIEDSRFYEHGAIDLKGTLRALVTNAQAGTVQQGGSTLTQQYVKRVLVESALLDQNKQAAQSAQAQRLSRKIQELRYAIGLEQKLSKDEILTRYLNIAYFGSGAYGIEAAARHFFSKPAKDLTLPEAALLAGLVRGPGEYDPILNPQAAQARRDVVLDRMAQLGMVTQAQADQAKQAPLGLKVTKVDNGCAGSTAPFFCDYVLNVIRNEPIFGKTPQDRIDLLLRGGLTIKTSLDPRMQAAAQAGIDAHLAQDSPVATAEVMLQPGTGAVVAMASNRRYGEGNIGLTKLNLAVDKAYGGSVGFQAGSTFKPFVLAAALRQGLPVSLTFPAPPRISFGADFRDCRNGRPFRDTWQVSNYENESFGRLDMKTATWRSVNTYYAQLEKKTGFCEPMSIAQAIGVHRADGQPNFLSDRSFVLGPEDVSPLTMAEAYATFAARGLHCSPRPITEVTDRAGKALPVPPPQCNQALDPKVADAVNWVLAQNIDGPDPYRTGRPASFGRVAAGKTGTTDGQRAVWFIGYTPNLASAVWAGFPTPGPLVNIRTKDGFFPKLYGGALPAPIWRDSMRAALEGLPAPGFTPPDQSVLNGTPVTVPDVSGLPVDQAVAKLQNAGFQTRVAGGTVNSTVGAGLVAYTSPSGGSSTTLGDLVTLFVSDGNPSPPPQPTTPATPAPTATPSPGGNGQAAPCKPDKQRPICPPPRAAGT
ncbi:MAG: penicillin-binding protein [Actinomycetota bacterium]